MGRVYLTIGEPWFLRLILLRKPATSFNELKTVNGLRFETFQDAAVKAGYVNNHLAAKLCFDELRHQKAPKELRVQFVTMTLAGYPTLMILEDVESTNAMILDFLQFHEGNRQLAHRTLFLDFSKRFKASNASMADYGLDEPPDKLTDYEMIKLKFNPDTQKLLFEDFISKSPFTSEMQVVSS